MSGPKFSSRTTQSFWRCFGELPIEVRRQASTAFRLWRADPAHPSLHFKRIKGKMPVYSVRVGSAHRALGSLQGDRVLWFWIGDHDEYMRVLGG